MHVIIPSFFTLVVVILVSRMAGMAFQRFGQPSVMGEIMGGIILGPSFTGYFFPQVTSTVFNPEALTLLKHCAEIGILLYLFIMGLEIDLPRLRKSAHSAFFISQASIFLPFVLGVVMASLIYLDYAPPGVERFEFSIFLGVALSITAFPVLARILADTNLQGTALGELALVCAAANDVMAWCLVALITGLIQSSLVGAGFTLVLTIFYVILMMWVARPLVEKLIYRLEAETERGQESLFAFVIMGALASAALTEMIGIHGLFGAFLFGAIIPSHSLIARTLTERLKSIVGVLFLPAFFALTGLKTQLGLLSSFKDWIVCLAIIVLAIVGKFGGTYIAAIFSGKSKRESTILGILMNTRGMVEIIVLNIGLSVGVLTPALFTILVIMAIVTTLMTGPLLRLVDLKLKV